MYNSHTSHCYVISFGDGAGKRLDVIMAIMKYMQCSVSCPPGKKEAGVKFFCERKLYPTFKIVAPPLDVSGIVNQCQQVGSSVLAVGDVSSVRQ